jgi:hypothetical protein
MGPKPEYSQGTEGLETVKGLRSQSLLPRSESDSKRPDFRPAGGVNSPAFSRVFGPGNPLAQAPPRAYSAASASNDFGFADDIMKSLMRGTISERKREPLNTP